MLVGLVRGKIIRRSDVVFRRRLGGAPPYDAFERLARQGTSSRATPRKPDRPRRSVWGVRREMVAPPSARRGPVSARAPPSEPRSPSMRRTSGEALVFEAFSG